ncbi:MAG: AsmA-like C-terminal domain-containing protein [Pseudomonadota bacterium]
MAASPFKREQAPRGGLIGHCTRGLRICLRMAFALAMLGLVAASLLYLRLQQGPLPVQALADLVVDQVNDRIDGAMVSVGGAEFSLAAPDEPAGLSFTDVVVRAADGSVLMAAPRLAARFDPADLVLGRIQPTRILLIGASARVERGRDGRFRFGLGAGQGIEIGGGTAGEPGADAIATIVRGFVGDAEPTQVLEKLGELGIIRADLTYADARTGRRWDTRGSDLRLVRTREGARALMRASISDRLGPEAQRTRLTVGATRKRGTFRTDFTIRTRRLRPQDVADQVEPLAWLRAVDAPIDGMFKVSVLQGGQIGPLSGRIEANEGALYLGDGTPRAFKHLNLAFEGPDHAGAVRISRAEFKGDTLDMAVSGQVVTEADPLSAGPIGIGLDIERLRIDEPSIFSAPLEFTGGRISALIDPAAGQAQLSEAALWRDEMVLGAQGVIRRGPESWRADLRATGQSITVADLKAHWPLIAARNARAWVDEHLVSGSVPELVAQLRLGPETELALDFRYADLTSRYLGDMSPIEDASGRAHMTLDDLWLSMKRGQVVPASGRPVRLDGSRLHLSGLDDETTWGDIDLTGSGALSSVLALIDEPPLGLVSRLGIDPGAADGQSQVTAQIRLPLEADLALDDVEVGAVSTLSDVALTLPLGGQPTAITADQLSLTADVREMRIAGVVDLGETPMTVDWRERYGDGPGARDVEIDGRVTPDFLAARGVPNPVFTSGEALARLSLAGDSEGTRVTAEVDLAPAELDATALRWAKPAGEPGRLRIEGRLGEAVTLDRIEITAAGLEASGRLGLDASGAIIEGVLERLTLDDRAEIAATIKRATDGVTEVAVTGPTLDLSEFVSEPTDTETADGPPLRLTAQIDRLRLTPKLEIAPTSGFLIRNADGATKLELEGRVGGAAPFAATYARNSGEPAFVSLRSEDAGRLLGAIGLFTGGRGGDLAIDARLKPETGVDARGMARITDVVVRSDGTFGSILEEGGVSDAAEAVQDGGLAFDDIEIPFSYSDGRLTLGDSVARSALLAIKVKGTVDETSEQVALAGVISPAYALTGALDEIPLIGSILSGGRGEGILAMTFQVQGKLDAPEFTVNPLSVLTPGFLRGLFRGSAEQPREDFLQQLGPTE